MGHWEEGFHLGAWGSWVRGWGLMSGLRTQGRGCCGSPQCPLWGGPGRSCPVGNRVAPGGSSLGLGVPFCRMGLGPAVPMPPPPPAWPRSRGACSHALVSGDPGAGQPCSGRRPCPARSPGDRRSRPLSGAPPVTQASWKRHRGGGAEAPSAPPWSHTVGAPACQLCPAPAPRPHRRSPASWCWDTSPSPLPPPPRGPALPKQTFSLPPVPAGSAPQCPLGFTSLWPAARGPICGNHHAELKGWPGVPGAPHKDPTVPSTWPRSARPPLSDPGPALSFLGLSFLVWRMGSWRP